MRFFKLFLIGMLMGIADLIPGISSATVAYSLNTYQVWLEALNSISLKQFLKLNLRAFFNNLNYSLLVPILLGATCSIFIFVNIISIILNDIFYKEIFLIIISILLLFACLYFSENILIQTKIDNIYLLVGFLFAIIISYLPIIQTVNIQLSYVFIVAMLSSFAMLLPGISGSFVLLMFNLYEILIIHLKHFLEDVLQLNFFTSSAIFLAVFTIGIVFGVGIFSKFLKDLLKNYPKQTNLVLFGLMLGSAFCFATIIVKTCLIILLIITLLKLNIVKSH